MSSKGIIAQQIDTLDPEQDYQRIVFLLTCYEFPWETERALEFALFRSYAVPSISRLLHNTGEFIYRPRKRYDDTELLLAEILENGFDSKRGQRALQRINLMHGRFAITNKDFLYVLSTFIFEPIRWIERFGWRELTSKEKRAMFNYYCELGRRMNIDEIPAEMTAFERYNQKFERDFFSYAETNHRIGTITRDLVLSFYLPRFLVPMARPLAHALMDEPLRRAMGFPSPPVPLRIIMAGALKLRRWFVGWRPRRRQPYLLTKVPRPTYPEGYNIEDLGV
jgi:hypothetical protein